MNNKSFISSPPFSFRCAKHVLRNHEVASWTQTKRIAKIREHYTYLRGTGGFSEIVLAKSGPISDF